MSFLSKIFGKKQEPEAPRDFSQTSPNPNDNPDLIKVMDSYGREMFITRQAWLENVLLGNLEKARDQPDQLYSLLVSALQDGFAEEVIPFAEHLARTDPIPTRGATILGILYMKANRIEEAERVLTNCLEAHGEDGTVLTNLAKVYSLNGENEKVEATLWRGLQTDPNQDNGLYWYAAIHRDRGGEQAEFDAYRRVAELPSSWHSQLVLAAKLLEEKKLSEALALYETALERGGSPTPSALLSTLTGDLGRNGYLKEALEFARPRFSPELHGLEVGNNLIKANLELREFNRARAIIEQLYSQKRPDWQETLNFWDHELAKAMIESKRNGASEKAQSPVMTLFAIKGALWAAESSPHFSVLPSKRVDAPSFGFFGSTVLFPEGSHSPGAQLSDSQGRLSRIVPVALAEKVHLTTTAKAKAFMPIARDHGFAVFGRAYTDEELCQTLRQDPEAPDYVIHTVLNGAQDRWTLSMQILRANDAERLAECEVDVDINLPGLGVENLASDLMRQLGKIKHIEPAATLRWYQVPTGNPFSSYLLRLEQQLAVVCSTLEESPVGLSGEREILDGTLRLCLDFPKNALVRILFSETVRRMRIARPQVVAEFADKIRRLQSEYPIEGELGRQIDATLLV